MGGTSGDTLVPGYLSVVLGFFADPDEIRFISVTSPNGTEKNLTAVLNTPKNNAALEAGTVAFNGFSAIGGWTIKALDGSGNLASQNASLAILRLGLQPCDRILPAADCFGNNFDGKLGVFNNQSLLGTALSSTPTAMQFHADLPPACCLPLFSTSITLQFSNSPAIGGVVSASGRSPDPGGANFTLAGNVQPDIGFRIVIMVTNEPDFAGNPAAGLWNFNVSTNGFVAIIGNALQDPRMQLALEPCP